MRASLRLVTIAAICLGCVTVDTKREMLTDRAVKRAAFEANCDAQSLTTDWLNSTTVGISGCGHRLVYVYPAGCAHDKTFGMATADVDRLCTPLLNSESGPPE